MSEQRTIEPCLYGQTDCESTRGGVCVCGINAPLTSNPHYVFCCGSDVHCKGGCECQCHDLTERVERLTAELAKWEATVGHSTAGWYIREVVAERDRLRAALQWMLDGKGTRTAAQCLDKAREALAGSHSHPSAEQSGGQSHAQAIPRESAQESGVRPADETTSCPVVGCTIQGPHQHAAVGPHVERL